MNNEKEREVRNSKNSFELEGNVANINNIYTNQNGKKMLRFDLAQIIMVILNMSLLF